MGVWAFTQRDEYFRMTRPAKSAATLNSASPIDRHVGARIRMRRKILGVSQEKLADSLGLTGTETFTVTGITALNDGTTPSTVHVEALGDGAPIAFDAVVRIDTPGEADYYRHGGIMQYVLRSLLK